MPDSADYFTARVFCVPLQPLIIRFGRLASLPQAIADLQQIFCFAGHTKSVDAVSLRVKSPRKVTLTWILVTLNTLHDDKYSKLQARLSVVRCFPVWDLALST